MMNASHTRASESPSGKGTRNEVPPVRTIHPPGDMMGDLVRSHTSSNIHFLRSNFQYCITSLHLP